jgi:hypothetical protein
MTATQITPHGIYVLVVIIGLFLIAKLLQTNSLHYWYYLVLTLALSFVSIEYAPLLLITLILCVLIHHRTLFPNWTRCQFIYLIVFSAIIFFGSILIIWPGGLLKLSLLKNYTFFVYFTFIRGEEYGAGTFWSVWWDRISIDPILYILIIVASIIACIKVPRHNWYLPFLIYPFLMIITTLRNTSISPTYISSLFPPLYVLVAVILCNHLKYLSKPLYIAIIWLIIPFFLYKIHYDFIPYQTKRAEYTPFKNVVNYLSANRFENKKFIIDWRILPTLNFYLPHGHFSSYNSSSKTAEDIISIKTLLENSTYDGVLYISADQINFQKQLQRYFSVEAEIVSSDPLSRIVYVYYKLQK